MRDERFKMKTELELLKEAAKEAAEKALPYYIEAVERYDRGEV